MPRVLNNNIWGSAGSGVDQQRADLFKVVIDLPTPLGGANAWIEHVEFAVEKFPFPPREREMNGIKYLNKTNFMLGPDVASQPITIPVRYAFNQPTAQLLEKWHYLTSNPETGGVSITSRVKTNGYFYWLVPNQTVMENIEGHTPADGTLIPAVAYKLEGCLIKGLKYTDADMTVANGGGVNMELTIQIDRWFPADLKSLVIKTNNGVGSSVAPSFLAGSLT
jgi:hypothetical protein